MILNPNSSCDMTKFAFNFVEYLCKFSLNQPVFLCVGNSNVVADIFGPMCGYILKNKYGINLVYGDLKNNITSSNLYSVYDEIKAKYPDRPVCVIDAALVDVIDVDTVTLTNYGCIPSCFSSSKLIGNMAILGNINVLGLNKLMFLKTVKFDMVTSMANFVCEGIFRGLKIAKTIKSSSNKNRCINGCICGV